MSQQLKIETQILENETVININGPVDEDSEFLIIESLTTEVLFFDLNGVTLINSCGVREWINMVERIPESSKIVYRNVPQLVIEQMNMVKGFLTPNSSIESFFAPYYREEDDKIIAKLLKADEIKDGKAPLVKDEEGNELEFDAIEAQYFNFLNQQGK